MVRLILVHPHQLVTMVDRSPILGIIHIYSCLRVQMLIMNTYHNSVIELIEIIIHNTSIYLSSYLTKKFLKGHCHEFWSKFIYPFLMC